MTIAPTDPTADRTLTLPDASGAAVISTLTTNAPDVASGIWLESNNLVFEGVTANGFETRFLSDDPTADRDITIPNMTGTLPLSTYSPNNVDVTNSVWLESNAVAFEGVTADGFETFISSSDVTADRTVTTPNQSGVIHVSSGANALTAGASVTLTVQPGNALFTDTIITDNQDQTIDASGTGSAGDTMTIIFVTDAGGGGDEVITFGTNLLDTGTLTLANVEADVYVISFASDGTQWIETARTAVQTT